MRTPILEYFLSDTYGRRETNPQHAAQDADAVLTTDLARLERVLMAGTPDQIRRFHVHEKINTNGRPAVAAHIAKLLVDWNERYKDLLREKHAFTGLFFNDAPRHQREGGEPSEFYVVETDNHARIVGTPLESFAPIAPHVSRAWRVPNTQNGGLWEDGTQFRSATAHLLLDQQHSFAVQEIDASAISDAGSLDTLRVRFVDIYGNIIGYGGRTQESRVLAGRLIEKSASSSREISITIGGTSLSAEAARSLEDGKPGTIIAYPNGGNPRRPHIDIARKWTASDRTSAYDLFGKPEEGEAEIQIR